MSSYLSAVIASYLLPPQGLNLGSPQLEAKATVSKFVSGKRGGGFVDGACS